MVGLYSKDLQAKACLCSLSAFAEGFTSHLQLEDTGQGFGSSREEDGQF